MEKSPKKSVLDSMNELYTWLTAWDKDVNKQVRKRDVRYCGEYLSL